MLVSEISGVEDQVLEELLEYIQTGSSPDDISGTVEVKDNSITYRYFCLHPCINHDADRNYTLKKSIVVTTKQEIKQECKSRNI